MLKFGLIALGCLLPTGAFGGVVINEVADKGTSGDYVVCDAEEWIELAATEDVSLAGYKLYDDKGAADADAYTFPAGTSITAGSKLVLCRKESFQFKVGVSDTVSLADEAGTIVDTTGAMPGEGRDNKVWARIPDVTGAFQYSGTPTADAANVLSDPPTVPPTTTTAAPITQKPSQGELDNPDSSCARLRAEYGLDCNACLESLPAAPASCPTRTVTEDTQAEIDALFGHRKDGAPRELYANTSFLFATDDVWNIEFDLSQKDWTSMTSDPAAEAWHTGQVRFKHADGTALVNPATGKPVWEGVGIRFKGFFGSLRICLTGMVGDCAKLSYKLKFNHVVPDARFFGLKMLQLHAASGDLTKMRERLSYGLFREMGVPAPRSAFSSVALKVGSDPDAASTLLGVHLLTEVIDGRFTDTYFNGGDGNLYKELWPGSVGADGLLNEANFIKSLRTNEGDEGDEDSVADASALLMFSQALAGANNDYDLAKVAKKWLSAKRWAAQLAVDRAIEHWDGPVNFRGESEESTEDMCSASPGCADATPCFSAPGCQNGERVWTGLMAACAPAAFCASCYPDSPCGEGGRRHERSQERRAGAAGTHWTHNFFLYEEDRKNASKREFDLVPWDLDNTWPDLDDPNTKGMLGERPDWDKAVCAPGDTTAGTDCIKCELFATSMSEQMPISCFKMFRAFAVGLRRYYINAAEALLAGPLQPCRVNAKLDRWTAALKPYLDADKEAGLYPEWGLIKMFTGTAGITEFAADFKNRVVPRLSQRFKDSVTCGKAQNTAANADAWGATIEEPIIGLMMSDEMGIRGAVTNLPSHPEADDRVDNPCLENGATDDDCCAGIGTASCTKGYAYTRGGDCFMGFAFETICTYMYKETTDPRDSAAVPSGAEDAQVQYFKDPTCDEPWGEPSDFSMKCEAKDYPWGPGVGFGGCSDLGCGGCGGPNETDEDMANCEASLARALIEPGYTVGGMMCMSAGSAEGVCIQVLEYGLHGFNAYAKLMKLEQSTPTSTVPTTKPTSTLASTTIASTGAVNSGAAPALSSLAATVAIAAWAVVFA